MSLLMSLNDASNYIPEPLMSITQTGRQGLLAKTTSPVEMHAASETPIQGNHKASTILSRIWRFVRDLWFRKCGYTIEFESRLGTLE